MKCSSHRAMRSALNYVNTKHIICLKHKYYTQTIFLQILCIDIAINSIFLFITDLCATKFVCYYFNGLRYVRCSPAFFGWFRRFILPQFACLLQSCLSAACVARHALLVTAANVSGCLSQLVWC